MLPNQLRFKRLIKYFLYLCLLLVLGGIGFFMSVSWGMFGHVYSKEELKEFQNELATTVMSSDNKTLGHFYSQNREKIDFDSIPKHVLNCLVATEDARYYEHEGVDSKSMLRVLFKSIILNDKSSGGGSTITQQLAKNMFGRKSYGFLTMPVIKCKEIILASRLEDIYTKDQILALYLNTVPFGENIYGIQSASKRFFNKPASRLMIEEGAVIIGMLKANSYYNPRKHKDHAQSRRNTVLSLTAKSEFITPQEKDSLIKIPLEINYNNLNQKGPAQYFLVEVRKKADEIIKKYNDTTETPIDIDKDGLIIKTTLNHGLQKNANQAFQEHLSIAQEKLLKQYRKNGKSKKELTQIIRAQSKNLKLPDELRHLPVFTWENGVKMDSISGTDSIRQALLQLHAGFLAMDPQSGAIRSWIGGINFQTHPYDQVKAKRQLASTFKPILYAAAIENGRRPCDYLSNEEIILSDFKDWHPENYDKTSGGKYSVAAALANSKNIPAVRLYFETGFEKVNKVWEEMGFSSQIKDNPSLALGTATGSILELATGISAIANGGSKINPHLISEIITQDGVVIYQNKNAKLERIIDQETAWSMSAILKKAINEGTGTPIRRKYKQKIPFAGKTGTSQDFSDAWFVGFNPGIIMVSRVGANSPAIHFNNGKDGSGSRLALPIVGLTLEKSTKNRVLKRLLNSNFDEEVDDVRIDCKDFMDENKLEKLLKRFDKKERTLQDEQKKAKRRKKNPLRRLLNW